MISVPSNRRLVLATFAASLLPMREAVAQTAAAGGDWFAMIQQHHALVAKTFDRLLASQKATYLARERLVRTLNYQLTAHSVAEENVIYPAIAMAGLRPESDKLYMDQAHTKVMNSTLELQTAMKDKGNWMQPATTLRDAVLKHAKDDEEGRLYPQLRSKLTAAENALLTANYQREFNSVKPVQVAA
ncbi:MAG: Hemerythrin domain protein [uncultured Ramlibacter sp.]|uniref:Hemerythrin domain protein n=1 Tax=uncultured Ramlibacter sp. TaxID=260755 RepID=A0A6J4PM85_9BURK|nr:MAG: Hemerythrin domain protein [uncultured Ramlibacter sp.]